MQVISQFVETKNKKKANYIPKRNKITHNKNTNNS